MALPAPFVEQAQLGIEEVWLKIMVNGTTAADSSIYAVCKNASNVGVYSDTDSQTIASALGFTTSDLDDDAAAGIIGIHVPVGDAAELIDVQLGMDNAASAALDTGTTLGNLTAVTVGRFGASTTGVTSAYDLAFILTLTSLDIDSAVGTATFWIKVVYRKRQGS